MSDNKKFIFTSPNILPENLPPARTKKYSKKRKSEKIHSQNSAGTSKPHSASTKPPSQKRKRKRRKNLQDFHLEIYIIFGLLAFLTIVGLVVSELITSKYNTPLKLHPKSVKFLDDNLEKFKGLSGAELEQALLKYDPTLISIQKFIQKQKAQSEKLSLEGRNISLTTTPETTTAASITTSVAKNFNYESQIQVTDST